MTLPRRTILTRIAAALAALSAPVVALGAGRRRAKRRMGSAKGLMWVAPDFDAEANAPADWARAENENAWARERNALHALLAEARGLLAEARAELARWYGREPVTFKRKDGSTWDYIVPLPRDDEFLARIDSHLGRGAGREGQE